MAKKTSTKKTKNKTVKAPKEVNLVDVNINEEAIGLADGLNVIEEGCVDTPIIDMEPLKTEIIEGAIIDEKINKEENTNIEATSDEFEEEITIEAPIEPVKIETNKEVAPNKKEYVKQAKNRIPLFDYYWNGTTIG